MRMCGPVCAVLYVLYARFLCVLYVQCFLFGAVSGGLKHMRACVTPCMYGAVLHAVHVGQIGDDRILVDPNLPLLRCCTKSVYYRSTPGNVHWIMQIIRLLPGSMSQIIQIIQIMQIIQIIQIRNTSALPGRSLSCYRNG